MYSPESDGQARSSRRGTRPYLTLGQIAGKKPIASVKQQRVCKGVEGTLVRCLTSLSRYNLGELCSICESRNPKSGSKGKRNARQGTKTTKEVQGV